MRRPRRPDPVGSPGSTARRLVRWLGRFAPIMAGLLVVAAARDLGAVELRWRLLPGQVYRVNVERVVRQNSPAAQWTDETRYQLVWSVQSVDTTGTAEILQTLAEVRETLRWGESEPIEYDSTSKQELHGDALNFARHWQPQLNSERRFRLSPLGQWLAASPVESGAVPAAGGGPAGESPSSRGAGTGSENPPGVASSGPDRKVAGTPLPGNAPPEATAANPAANGGQTNPASNAPGPASAARTASPAVANPPATGSNPPSTSPANQPTNAAAGSPALPGGVRPIYCVLPVGPLQMGTQWTETHTMPQGDRPDAWQLTTAFRYVGSEEVEDRSLHRIDVDCRWRSAPAASGAGGTAVSSLVLERQEGAGQIFFDQEAGHMASSQLSQELITRSRRADGTTFQSEIVTTVRLRIEPVAPPVTPAPGVEEVEPPPTVSPPVTPAAP